MLLRGALSKAPSCSSSSSALRALSSPAPSLLRCGAETKFMNRAMSTLGRGVTPAALSSSCVFTNHKRHVVQEPQQVNKRFFNLHEYQAVMLFDKHKIAHPKVVACSTPEEAFEACKQLPGPDYVIKAQVLTGGRGRGRFLKGFQGGVHVLYNPESVKTVASKMLGDNLVTKQSGEKGKPCNKVLVCERLYFRRETYFAILMDRQYGGPVMVASPSGGMDIETVAKVTPELIFKEPVDIFKGPSDEALNRLAAQMGFDRPDTIKEAKQVMRNLYELFDKRDCTLVEINPLAETHDYHVVCADGKLNFDVNAEFRQKDVFAMRDSSQEDFREVIAHDHDLNYIGLEGNIGCLVNGAGLAMATMDAIKLAGGAPANFLDMGGSAKDTQVLAAFRLLDMDPLCQAILVNIFGGIMRCDVIALGLIKAVVELNIKKPIIVRLAGTNKEKANQLIEDSGLRMVTANDLGDAAKKAVRVAEILDQAKAADLGVTFALPL
eukprot:gb/GEZN01005847.1/.p1 GENE.gb/GEZN01005847.1/~~gb/GEZN01005847.1/.p1  ORF type:complete len:493 (+),score=90.12 gb/GEZN01005847.1/:38-1516(+)